MIIDPITPQFAAEVGGVDLARPLGNSDWKTIQDAFWQYSVLVFPDQHLSIEQHLAFAKKWGTLQTSIEQFRPGSQLRVPAEIADVSNLTYGDKIWAEESPRRLHEMANRLWHTDNSFRTVPALASLLYARSIPPVGGRTEFADLRGAYDSLSDELKDQLQGQAAEHCIRYSRARIGFTNFSQQEIESMPPVAQAVVRRIPQSGRKTLYLASHARHIIGMPDQEGRDRVDELIAHATKPENIYIHRWRV
ncbi:MAG: TauD/TfdA family dioxygenase, partial [Planctomycetaceae bacterium]|nr:TauD/TfdA family dioxygenase [Planctomycetaceae bacterium]